MITGYALISVASNSNNWIPFLFGLAGAVLPVSVGAFLIRRKTKAETANILTEAAARLIVAYEQRIADLEKRLDKSEDNEKACLRRVMELEAKIETLTSQKKAGEGPSNK